MGEVFNIHFPRAPAARESLFNFRLRLNEENKRFYQDNFHFKLKSGEENKHFYFRNFSRGRIN